MKTRACVAVILTAAVLSSGCLAQPAVNLKPGDKAPDFRLQGSDGKEYTLAGLLGKHVVLCWFPRAGSQGAINQCANLQAVMASIPADKVQVFGCSTAALDVSTAFARQGNYGFPVLADSTHAAAQAYGCLRPDGAASERWTFLIDDTGMITAINRTTSPQTQGADLLKMLADAGLAAPAVATGPVAVPVSAANRWGQQITVQVGAQTRTCIVHTPPAYDGKAALPLVIVMHGARGNGQGMAAYTGFNAIADQSGFITAYPDGIAGDHTWNALFGKIPGGEGVLADDVDDVGFLRVLITYLRDNYHADSARVFACGHSAGAYMAYRAAVELPDLVAAAGVVNGSLGIKSLDGKPCDVTIPTPAEPVSLIHIRGKQDNAVRFEGAQTPKNLFKSTLDCIQFFVQADHCATPGQDTRDEPNGVSRTLYTGGQRRTEVELVVVDRCGHGWPTPNVGLSASQELWDFFSTHPKLAQ